MNGTVPEALVLWGLAGADYRLVAARENAVYRVDTSDQTFALRLHRKGYRSNAELQSELDWMAACAKGGLHVPAPVAAADGAMLRTINGVQVSLLTWLPGAQLQAVVAKMTRAERADRFGQLGIAMARLHQICDAWTPPHAFTRCAWDIPGLVGDMPLWDRFWRNPALSQTDRDLFIRVRDVAHDDLQQQKETLDFGLIHADLVPANIMVDATHLGLIDFDDGGFGFRLFEVATALLKFRGDSDFGALQSALITGYRSLRALDTNALPLFLTLRALSYVGWNISRMQEDCGTARNARFIATARDLSQIYLAKH